MSMRFAVLLPIGVASALCTGCSGDDDQTSGGAQDPEVYLTAPRSCAYDCPDLNCPETTTPYVCPALGAWKSIPHMPQCPAWDGKYPAAAAGKCTATEPAGEAIKRPGLDAVNPGAQILPDGRFIRPAGQEWVFNETNIEGGTTVSVIAVPGTSFVLAVDTGNDDHAVRAIDTTRIGTSNPVTAMVKFSPPEYLNSGIAVVAPGRAYVATDYGVVQAFSFDAATGALARDDAASLPLPAPGGEPFYVAGVATSPDGRILVVSPVQERNVLVFDIDPASPTYRQQLGALDIGERETFGIYFDPNDPAGTYAYASVWGSRKVVEVNLTDPAAPVVSRTFATDSNPQGIAFLDARWMVVANDYGETISLVDRTSGMVTSLPVDFEPGQKGGLDVAGVVYDAVSLRVYVTLAGINAIGAYDVDLAPATPTLTPAGRLPTSWWPSGLVVHPDGSLTVVNMRGGPIGPFLESHPIGGGNADVKMRGSVQQIALPLPADLAAGEVQVAQTVAVGAKAGYPTIDCPAGAADFPVPQTNDGGPSPAIQHIFFIVRENKTFDALLGDLPTVEGDPQYAMKGSTEGMDHVWTNFRDLARTFTISDNFYNLAIKSTQGHQWTTYGRTTDFCERTWSSDSRTVPLCGVAAVGRPDEGSLFEWLQKNNVVYDILGEIVGNPAAPPPNFNPIDIKYPGGFFQNITYNDLEKACYTAGRLRVACNLGQFVYMTLPNDHTVGVSPDNPSPEVMCAVNDEATGMFIDALSHSPLWASSLVIVTEDDPQQGGDHIDYHRTPLLLASPWVRRAYVSKTHIDVASLHKIFAHVLGLPYPNLIVKNAGLPLDMFTATPDYTPYTYKPRTWPLECGKGATRSEMLLTDSWDFTEVDNQPGLGEQVMRWMRRRQLTELPADLKAQIDARNARRARGLPPLREEDDD